MPNDPGKQIFYPTGPSFFPPSFTALEYPPYLLVPLIVLGQDAIWKRPFENGFRNYSPLGMRIHFRGQ